MSLFGKRLKPIGRPCLSPLNLANLSKEQTADMQLEIRASRLIRLVKLGRISKHYVREELSKELDFFIHENFKDYLNKYTRMMK